MATTKIYTDIYWSKDKDRYDITVKGGTSIFAPSWKMVMDYRRGLITEDEYKEEYLELLRTKLFNKECMLVVPDELKMLMDKPRIVLVCFCKKAEFCHRVLLAEYLSECFPDKFLYVGEL